MLVGGVDAEKPFVLSGSSAAANAADTNLIASCSAFDFDVCCEPLASRFRCCERSEQPLASGPLVLWSSGLAALDLCLHALDARRTTDDGRSPLDFVSTRRRRGAEFYVEFVSYPVALDVRWAEARRVGVPIDTAQASIHIRQ